ncbi:hypothetical protein BDP81DRAFT_389913 [Colletotrichum phormii]|uniref:C3H1-type domain-containing protein n=1 Tax=Colletotrichum phormii TaxID=359342 RepID=A0AAJ0A2I6_9PEZI|nr:uncharacterized protein BDP81DRAFT_389913 [Colletotrichum phormii]KAK1654899.1 hypothetical protein BDP81DRAFT_389913 [Colletotrichum phormii]
MDCDNHDKASSPKKQKICQSRMPKAQRKTCRHYLGARCNYGRDACNFPHREDELPVYLVEAARQLEEELQARARLTPVFYNNNNNNNGNITYHHGNYVSHGDYANSSSGGACNQAPSRYMGYYTQPPLPNIARRPNLEGPNQQAIAYHTAQIANPMPNTLGPVNFDGTRGQRSSYYSPPPALVPAQPVPPPAYAPPGPYSPQHIVHRQGYAGPFPPGPPPYYPAGANWGPPQFHHHHHHHHHPPGPPTGFVPYWDPAPAPAPPPDFEPGQGYGLPLPPLPAKPEHWPADAAAAASPEPEPEQAPVPNTAPASVTDSKEDHSTTRCWHGRNCKKPGCHYLHDGDVTASSNGNGNDNGNGEGSSSSSSSSSGGCATNALDNYIQDAIDNGPENGGIDLGDGNDDSASWAGDINRPPSPSPTDQSSEAATPHSSPRQLPASVAGDVTPPSLEHNSEEHSEEEADAVLSTIEEETPKAHPEEEEHSEDEEEELSTVEQQTPETPSEEVDTPAPVGETHEEETPAQPPARRGPLVVDGRSGWGLRKVKGKQRAV